MRFPTAFAAVGLILVAASATACSGGSKTAATAPPASAGASGTATTPGASTIPDSSSAKSFDVCTALTAAAVATFVTAVAAALLPTVTVIASPLEVEPAKSMLPE